MLALPSRQFVREGAPVAAVLLFWSVLSWFAPSPQLAASVRDAGVVMAGLYVIRRGVALSSAVTPVERNDDWDGLYDIRIVGRAAMWVRIAAPFETDDIEAVLHENVRVAGPAAVWFLVAAAFVFLDQIWSDVGLPGAFVSPEGMFVRAFAGAGLGVVALYAVAVGISAFRGGASSEVAQADDGEAS